jgi:hypothetical protein
MTAPVAGYKPAKRTCNIEYTQYPGLTIVTDFPSIGESLAPESYQVDMTAATEEERLAAFAMFMRHVITWNILHPDTSDGQACPVCGLMPDQMMPTVMKSLKCLETPFVIDIVIGWAKSIMSVSLPKEMNSSNGMPNIDSLMKVLGELQSR